MIIYCEDTFHISLLPSIKSTKATDFNNNKRIILCNTEILKPFCNIDKVTIYIENATILEESTKTALESTLKYVLKNMEIQCPKLHTLKNTGCNIYSLISFDINSYLQSVINQFVIDHIDKHFNFNETIWNINFSFDFNPILCARDFSRNKNCHKILCFNENDLNTTYTNIFPVETSLISNYSIIVDPTQLFTILKTNAFDQLSKNKLKSFQVCQNSQFFFLCCLSEKK